MTTLFNVKILANCYVLGLQIPNTEPSAVVLGLPGSVLRRLHVRWRTDAMAATVGDPKWSYLEDGPPLRTWFLKGVTTYLIIYNETNPTSGRVPNQSYEPLTSHWMNRQVGSTVGQVSWLLKDSTPQVLRGWFQNFNVYPQDWEGDSYLTRICSSNGLKPATSRGIATVLARLLSW